jgi:hypothetical protein
VQTTLHSLSGTINKLTKQIVPKLDREQMTLAASHIRSLSITMPAENGFTAMVGYQDT